MRVGIPRGLLFARYGTAWQTVISALGHEYVVSPETNRAILHEGCRLAVDETCLSVKVYLGHVAWLARRTDAVLVPRVVSVRRDERECVKLWGILDNARNSLPEANIIGYSVDAAGLTHRAVGPVAGLYDFAVTLGASPLRAAAVTARAWLAQAAATAAAKREARARRTGDGPRILVAGHAYNLHDEMIGVPILKALRDLGCQVTESHDEPELPSRREAVRVSPELQWTNNRHLMGAVHRTVRDVDGVVLLVTFPCGPDSMTAELLVRMVTDVPVMTLVIDEHAGEGGLRTRIESFVDIVTMKRDRDCARGTAQESAA